jgi:hypothetical protein
MKPRLLKRALIQWTFQWFRHLEISIKEIDYVQDIYNGAGRPYSVR